MHTEILDEQIKTAKELLAFLKKLKKRRLARRKVHFGTEIAEDLGRTCNAKEQIKEFLEEMEELC